MIEWKETSVNGDIFVPIEFELTEEQGLRVYALEEIRPVALEWKTLHGSDPFSDASLNYLWDALDPFLEGKGYAPDRFRDRWSYILECDASSVQRERISPLVQPLPAQTAEKNRTTLPLSEVLAEGCIAYGRVEDNAILSVAVGRQRENKIEFTVETVPEARNKGYAAAALATAVASLEKGKTARYRCHRYHTASLAVAKAAGFRIVGKYYRYLGRRKNGI